MILCDVGNTSVDLFIEGQCSKFSAEDFDPATLRDDVYFVSVNSAFSERIRDYSNWHDLRAFIDWDKYYPTMGLDRIMVCEAVDDGVIVDAGSAITVDLMNNSAYQGGFISLGLHAAKEAYGRLSPALEMSFNFEVDLTIMAKNTPDALTVGFLAPLIEKIKGFEKTIFLTGGDAQLLFRFLPEAVVVEELIFQGMKKLIEKGVKC